MGRPEPLDVLAVDLVRLGVDIVKAARGLGLSVPPSVLARADHLIE